MHSIHWYIDTALIFIMKFNKHIRLNLKLCFPSPNLRPLKMVIKMYVIQFKSFFYFNYLKVLIEQWPNSGLSILSLRLC